MTLNETEMVAGECTKLEVYAEQYGVRSEKKVYDVCYDGKILPYLLISGGHIYLVNFGYSFHLSNDQKVNV